MAYTVALLFEAARMAVPGMKLVERTGAVRAIAARCDRVAFALPDGAPRRGVPNGRVGAAGQEGSMVQRSLSAARMAASMLVGCAGARDPRGSRPALRTLALAACLAGCSSAPSAQGPVSSPAPRAAASAAPAPTSRAAASLEALSPPYVEPAACVEPVPERREGSARARQVLQGRHTASIQSMAIGRQGFVATASEDGSVRLWDLARLALLRVLRSSELGLPHAVGFDDDGAKLTVSGQKLPTLVLDLDGRELGRSQRRGRAMHVAAGRTIVPSDFDYGSKLFWFELGGRRRELRLPDGTTSYGVRDMSMTPDGAAVVAGLDDKTLAIWATSATAPADPRIVRLEGRARSVALAPSGAFAIVAVELGKKALDPEGQVMLVPIAPPGEARALARGSFLQDVAISADSSLGAFVSYDELGVFELPSGKLRFRLASEKTALRHEGLTLDGAFTHAVFSPDGGKVVVAQNGGGLAVFDAIAGRSLGELGQEVAVPRGLVFAGPETLLSGTAHGITRWSLRDGSAKRSSDVPDFVAFHLGDDGRVTGARVPEFGGECAVGDATVYVDGWSGFDPPSFDDDDEDDDEPAPSLEAAPTAKRAARAPRAEWPPVGRAKKPICLRQARLDGLDLGHRSAIVAFERKTAQGSKSAVALEDLETHRRVVLERHDELSAVATSLSEDGTRVTGLTGSGIGLGNDAAVWDARSGRLLARTNLEVELGSGARLSGAHGAAMLDGRHLAIRYGRHLGVRSVPDGKLVFQLALEAPITSMAFVPVEGAANGRPAPVQHGLFVAGLEDGSLRLVRDGKVVGSGASDGGALRAIAADPTRRVVASRSDDGALRLWDLGTGALRVALAAFDDEEYIAFSPGGAYAGTAEVSDRVGWVFDGPPEPFRFEQFAGYRDEALVGRRLAGATEDKPATTDRPPRIVSLRGPDGHVDGPTARLSLRAATDSGRVEAVRVLADGRPVAAKAVCASQGDVEVDVPLLPGKNRLTVLAFDDRGFASNPMTLDVVRDALPGPRPDIHVVAVGVSRYPKLAPAYQLELADDDARGVAVAMAEQAGEGKPYAKAHVELLLDEAATVPSIDRALARLAAMAPGDVGVVFFAGHGVKPSARGDMVFLTSGAEPRRETLAESGIGWNVIGERLSAARGRVLVLLDACHSGHVSQDLVVQNGTLASSLVRDRRAGVVVLAAAKGRQQSYEPRGARGLELEAGSKALVGAQAASLHGFFTGALLESLRDAATDRDRSGAIEVSELIDTVTARVTRATRGMQTPWVARREILGDFRVAVPAGP